MTRKNSLILMMKTTSMMIFPQITLLTKIYNK